MPTAVGPAPAACRSGFAKPSSLWPAPPNAGFNDHHLCEKLCEIEGFSLSRETLRRLLRQAGIGSPRKRRAPPRPAPPAFRPRGRTGATRRLPTRLVGRPRPSPYRPRPAGRRHRKNPGRPVLSLRDRAGLSLAAPPTATPPWHSPRFLRRSQRHLRAQRRLLVGRRTTCRQTPAHPVRPRSRATGHHFIVARSPQAKGRVERLWGVLQDRLTSELRLAQACDLDSANTVLRNFVADYNHRFARRPREMQTAC
jgi:hypothetical protein